MEDKLNYFIARTDKNLDNIWKKLATIEAKLDAKHEKLNQKISELENFKARIIGLAIGASLLINGAWQVFSKLL